MSSTDQSHPKAMQTPKTQEQHLETQMEGLIGTLLLVGLVVSVSLILTGLIWDFTRTGQLGLDYTVQDENLYKFLWQDTQALFSQPVSPKLVLNLGVIVLLFTPYLRVVTSFFYFLLVERSLKYASFTGIVLLILTMGLFIL
jgi:uncharacterized membrane protein